MALTHRGLERYQGWQPFRFGCDRPLAQQQRSSLTWRRFGVQILGGRPFFPPPSGSSKAERAADNCKTVERYHAGRPFFFSPHTPR